MAAHIDVQAGGAVNIGPASDQAVNEHVGGDMDVDVVMADAASAEDTHANSDSSFDVDTRGTANDQEPIMVHVEIGAALNRLPDDLVLQVSSMWRGSDEAVHGFGSRSRPYSS